MNQVFIVRPFGTKLNINFDKVEQDLIQPALLQVGILGSTTASIVEQGNIREDMFGQLLLADLVIADMSIHNANVFYELGIRHALRDKRTFLIRCSVDGHDVPFDLKTDRYLSYDAKEPAKAVDALVAGLQATIISEKQDSPVFYMLPKLEAQDPERFSAVPSDFGEEVTLATASKQNGKLALLASEAVGFTWEIPAMRRLGEALYQVKDFEAAELCWQKIRDQKTYDQEANDRLSTIYQRQAEAALENDPQSGWELLAKSDLAIERLLTNYDRLYPAKRAEIVALKARNAKTRWVDTWSKAAPEDIKKKALQSTFLIDSYELYEKAFNEDLNHYYSGINALGMLTVLLALAASLPDIFNLEFQSDEEAEEALKKYKERHLELCTLVQASIASRRKRSNNEFDIWLNITEADLACLTSKRPPRVGGLYQKIIQEAKEVNIESARRQLQLYGQLGILSENVAAALSAFTTTTSANNHSKHYLLFTGHMIDKPDRSEPRFSPAIEPKVKEGIKKQVQEQQQKYGKNLHGISGGACGGDILFHEVCAELGVHSEMYLLLPREKFIVESVSFAGASWVDRFDDLFLKMPKQLLSETKSLPKWLQPKPGYSIWERNNLWMLHSALVCGGINLTMIALWDGKGGDGPGGTGHMVKEAKARGAKAIILDIKNL